MVKAVFNRTDAGFVSVEISGHAEFAPEGEDIVCASVTSAVQLVANGITEILNVPAGVTVKENLIQIVLPSHPDENSMAFLQALHLHFILLQQQYSQHIKVTVTEV